MTHSTRCGNPDGAVKQAVYSQRDAVFRGGEFQSQWDVLPLWSGVFGIENQFDVVRATFSDGTNVPRIPPVRIGGGFFWRDANWLARINLPATPFRTTTSQPMKPHLGLQRPQG